MDINIKNYFSSRTIAGCLLAIAVNAIPTITQAGTIYTFSGSDQGGTGTATMDIGISGNVLTIKLDNTSPLQLDNNSGTNTPGITGFGVNLGSSPPSLGSWSLTAFNTDGSGPLTIGATSGGTGDWILGTTYDGVTLNFLPNVGNGIQGALYNPLATSGFSALPNYETQAELILNFLSTPALAAGADCGSGLGSCITFVRFKAVGNGGSLKLSGTESSSGSPDVPGVPEPNNLSLLGLGLIAGVFVLRRRTLKGSALQA